MGKCTNVKFNGTYSDGSLLKVADVVFHVKHTNFDTYNNQVIINILSYDVYGTTIENPVIKATGGKITVGGVEYEEYTLPIDGVVYYATFEVENKDYDIVISNAKYSILNLYMGGTTDAVLNKNQIVQFDISQLKYCNIRNFTASRKSGGMVTGKFSLYGISQITIMDIANNSSVQNPAVIDVDSFADSTKITRFVAIEMYDSYGTIQSLAKNKGITRIAVGLTKVTGDVDAFAQEQVSEGRTSGTCTIEGQNTSITCSVPSANKVWNVTYNSGVTGGYTITAV